MINTIEELRQEVHNLQVSQAKPRQGKLIILTEPLQEIRNQIMPFRGRGGFKGRGRGRERGGFTRPDLVECWTCEEKRYMSGKCPESQCFLCYKKGHTVQFCSRKSVNLV